MFVIGTVCCWVLIIQVPADSAKPQPAPDLDGLDSFDLGGLGGQASNVTCRPVNVTNAVPKLKESSVGDVAVWQCLYGYRQIGGSDARICNKDGSWSGKDIVCGRVVCPAPPDIAASAVAANKNIFEGDTVTYKCRKYFRPHGNNSVKCLNNATWSRTDFRCDEMRCPDHPHLPNTERTGNAVAIGSFVEYACVEGYQRATLELTCQEDETWSKHNFTCIKKACGPPPAEPHATISGSDGEIGTEHKYSCDTGYWRSGEKTSISCNENETWSKPKFKCIAMKDCPQPPPVPFATWTVGAPGAEGKKTKFKHKTTVEYRCKWQPKTGEPSDRNRDYDEEDWDRRRSDMSTGGQWMASRTCQKDGTWTDASRDLKCWPPAKKSTVLKYKKGYVRRYGDCTGRDLKRIYLESHDRRRSDKCFVECSRMTECRSFLFVVMTKHGTYCIFKDSSCKKLINIGWRVYHLYTKNQFVGTNDTYSGEDYSDYPGA